jgi:hypothetical protein
MKLQVSVASIFVGLGMLAANNSHAANTCIPIFYKNVPVHVNNGPLRIPAGKVNFSVRACWDYTAKKAAPQKISDKWTATLHKGNFWFADGATAVAEGATNYFVENTTYKTFATSWATVSVKSKFSGTVTGGIDGVIGSGSVTLSQNSPAQMTIRSRTDYAGKCQLEVNGRVAIAWQACSNFSTP